MPTIELIACLVVDSLALVMAVILLITAAVFASGIAVISDIYLQEYIIAALSVTVAVVTIVLTIGIFTWIVKQWPILTTIFSISLLAVIVFILIGIISLSVTRGRLETSLTNQTTAIFEQYKNASNEQYLAPIVQGIQQSFKCCGVEAPTDWEYLTSNGTSTPDSCCLIITAGCGQNALVTKTGIYLDGCAQPIRDYFKLMYHTLLLMNIFLALLAVGASTLALHLRRFMRQRYSSF